jgi:hypothetical protein
MDVPLPFRWPAAGPVELLRSVERVSFENYADQT